MIDIRFPAALGAALACCLSTSALAQVPDVMPYQGHIAGEDGAGIDGSVSLTFRLYQGRDDVGPVWTEVWDDVPVDAGLFQVYLGMFTPMNDMVTQGQARYLGVAIGGEGEATPRQQLGSVPYAMMAGDATSLAGYEADDFVTWPDLGDRGYVTQADLAGYATRQWVDEQGYLTADDLGEAVAGAIGEAGYATEQWVRDNYLGNDALEGYASEQWVRDQGYVGADALEAYATEQWVRDQGYASEQWVRDQGYASEQWVRDNYVGNAVLEDYATRQWVSDNYLGNGALEGYASEQWVRDNYVSVNALADRGYVSADDLDGRGYITADDVAQAGYLQAADLDGYATEDWVRGQGYLTGADLDGRGYVTAAGLAEATDGLASEAYVQNQGYLTGADLDGRNYITDDALADYVTTDALDNRGYLTGEALNDYVTTDDLDNRGYLTGDALNNYVTNADLDALDLATNADLDALLELVGELQAEVRATRGAFLLGRSAQQSNGQFTFGAFQGVRAATAMCRATYANVPTAHLCSPEEVFQAVANGSYDPAQTATYDNVLTWTVADNPTSARGNSSIAANCQNLLYNSGDVASGTRLSVDFGYRSNGNGGGATGDIVQIQQEIGCGNVYPVLCCR